MIKISSFLLFFVCVAFSASVCDAYDNGAPHSRLPALGWSSWVALGPEAEHPIFDFCDETSVKAAIDAFVSDDLGLFDAGYRHFHLDDCWAGGRNSSGYLFPEKKNWPNGMKPVIDYAHSKGVVFGLYTCAGTLTCVGRRPGSKDHWKEDASLWASHLTLPWIGYAYIGCYLVHIYIIYTSYISDNVYDDYPKKYNI